MDLIVKNARLADRLADGPLDIAVADGRIAAIGKRAGRARRRFMTPAGVSSAPG